jgi:hypothetical protein
MLLAVLAVFVVWQLLDLVIHMVILSPAYAATADLWRPMEEMKMGLGFITGLVAALAFVLIYALFIKPKSVKNAMLYGLIYGVGGGIGMGFGTYTVMPITVGIAVGWFLGTVVESVAAGWVVGRIMRDISPDM